MSKVMESIVNRHLVNFVEREAVLSVRQFGFRRGLGASDLLTALHYEWNLVTNRGGVAKILAADIAGAFDKVSHSGVLYKAQCYGLTGRLLTWLTSYLSDRLIRTVVAGQSSASHQITAGVPQGSILGPTLFHLYTNDAEDSLPPEVHLAVYADDTSMYHLLQVRTDIERASATLQTAVDALSNWGRPGKSSLNRPNPKLSQSHITVNVGLSPHCRLITYPFQSLVRCGCLESPLTKACLSTHIYVSLQSGLDSVLAS